MSGRSPSGVASLRARFEQNADPESLTPTRGRSPAGSINSDTSRPISKVRTSFISVGEPSGQMGDFLSGSEAGKPNTGDGMENSKAREHSRPNGSGPTSAPRQTVRDANGTQEDQKTSEPSTNVSEKPNETATPDSLAAAGSGKLTMEKQENPTSAVSEDMNKEAIPSGGERPAKDGPDLGSILKGSAFEEAEAKKAAASQKPSTSGASKPTGKSEGGQNPSTAPKSVDPVKPPLSSNKSVNGKPKESQAAQTRTQSKPASDKAAPPNTQGPPKPTASTDTKPASDKVEKKEVSAPVAPGAASTSSGKDRTPKPNPAISASTATTTTAASPKKEPFPKKPEPSKEPVKTPATEPKPSTTLPDRKVTHPPETSRSSNTKATPSAAPTTSKAPAKKAVDPASPPTSGTGFVKPKPRSPTRPVNLPSHLTAQTAASAAKHGDDFHVEPHKDQTAGNKKTSGPKAPSHLPPQHRKPPRASMPAAGLSRAAEKEKPKPRVSVAGGNASGGSFLERMMRPTQASAQKTHDRVEAGKSSPPRKASGSRNVSGAGPKTVTGASTHKPDQHAHNDGGHGDREKHSGPPKSGVANGHEEGAHGSAKGKEVVPSAAEAEASAQKYAPIPAPEEANTEFTPSIMEGKPEDQATSAARPETY